MSRPYERPEWFAGADAASQCSGFFFVGIGGAGMSGIARVLHQQGFRVSGSDRTASLVTDRLVAEGIPVTIGHAHARPHEGDLIVVTDAVELEESPEVAWAREHGRPLWRRSQALAHALRDHKIIAVTGTHGKTTTTTMLGEALAAAGQDPLVIVGAEVPAWGSSARIGRGGWAVVEACEAYASFEHLVPHMVVLTNLEHDHVDFYPTEQHLLDAIEGFINRIENGGACFVLADDDTALSVAGPSAVAVLPQEAPAEVGAPGDHNRRNAALARAVALSLGAAAPAVDEALRTFSGAERRLQIIHDADWTLMDDYAHHPTEIQASIQALREKFPGRRLLVAFQPHLYSRTAPLLNEFAQALDGADVVILTDIYPAREAPMAGISSVRIAELMRKECHYVPSRFLVAREAARHMRPGDVVVMMGAGNIGDCVADVVPEVERLRAKRTKRITVLAGGDSAEREVSRLSGLSVYQALQRLGYDATLMDATERLMSGQGFPEFVGPNRPDLVVLAIHGTHAEDGALQGLLELLHIPYTGSRILASATGMDKDATKRVLAARGLDVPKGVLLKEGEGVPELRGLEGDSFVVKPNRQGSTVGLVFVERRADLPAALEKAFHYDTEVLVEEWVRGTEVSVPVLGSRVFPVVEIVPDGGRYDFTRKYVPGATEEICPARLDPALTRRIQLMARDAHFALGARGLTRTDMIVTEDRVVILEINTLPGMTPTSLAPRAAQADGLGFDELVNLIVEEGLAPRAELAPTVRH